MTRVAAVLRKAEDYFAFGLIGLLALMPTAEMTARLALRTGVPGSYGSLAQALLALGLFGAMIASRKGEHLNIALVGYLKKGALRSLLGFISATASSFILSIVGLSSISFVLLGLEGAKTRGILPEQWVAWLIPFAYIVMAFRMAVYERPSGAASRLPLIGAAAGALIAFPSLALAFPALSAPEWAVALSSGVAAFFERGAVLAVAIFILSAFAGTPLFVVIAAVALFFIGRANGGAVLVVPNQIYTQLINPSLPAIPLFTVAGYVLSGSRAGERLVGLFRSLFGWLPGGMIFAAVGVCSFLTTFTGASGVAILALGGLLSTILLDAGYPKAFVYGLLTAVGSIGILFPPSLPIILVGVATGTSVLKMFAGGILPGLALVVAMGVFGVFSALKHHLPVEPFSLRASLRHAKASFWELLLPVLLVVGYFSGLFSIVETAAFSVIYVIAIEVLVTKDVPFRGLAKIFRESLPIIGGILAILASSQALSYFIVDTDVPQTLVAWVKSVVSSRLVFILMLNLALIVAGCLMDIFSAIIVLMPLIAPLGAAFGLDPVQLGIIFVANMELGFLTPPVGLNLFLASYRFGIPFLETARHVLPFLLIQLLVVLVVSYWPWLTTALSGLF